MYIHVDASEMLLAEGYLSDKHPSVFVMLDL